MRSVRFRNIFFATVATVFLLSAFTAHAAIINIPDDQPTIQAGIDIAAESDTVLVAPGTYFENVDLSAKNITLASHYLTTADTTYMHETVINGGGKAGCIGIFNEETSTSPSIVGFTLRLSYGSIASNPTKLINRGSGISCRNAAPYIEHMIVENCYSINAGGSMDFDDSSPVIKHVHVTNCSAMDCGGIAFSESNALLEDVYIYGNLSNCLVARQCESVVLKNCVIFDNMEGLELDYSNVKVSNSLIFHNHITANLSDITVVTSTIDQVILNGASLYAVNTIFAPLDMYAIDYRGAADNKKQIVIANSFLKSGQSGITSYYSYIKDNFSEYVDISFEGTILYGDPVFVSGDLDKIDSYLLHKNSPAIDTGTAHFEWDSEVILDMQPEEYYGTAPDIGAYEYDPTVSVETDKLLPQTACLLNPSPNPFNPSTTISFTLSEPSEITLSIYNLNGQHVTDLASGQFVAGVHSAVWNAEGMASGIHFCVLDTGGAVETKRLLLLR